MAMVLTLMLVARKTMRLEDYITARHIDTMCNLVILTSGMVGLAYATEFFMAFYSGNRYEQFAFINRALGPLAWGYWIMVACNVLMPQLFWFTGVRRALAGGLHHLALDQRRHVVRAVHHHRQFAASASSCRRAGRHTPDADRDRDAHRQLRPVLHLFLLFCRFVPVIAMAEVKGVLQPAAGIRGAPIEAALPVCRASASLVRCAETGKRGRPLCPSSRARTIMLQATAAPGRKACDRRRVHAVRGPRPGSRDGSSRRPGCRGSAFCSVYWAPARCGLLQYWASAVSWPINVGGKPWNSLPAFVPVTFEVMVLCARRGHRHGVLSGRPDCRPGTTSPLSDLRVTDDRFALGAGRDRPASIALPSRPPVVDFIP